LIVVDICLLYLWVSWSPGQNLNLKLSEYETALGARHHDFWWCGIGVGPYLVIRRIRML